MSRINQVRIPRNVTPTLWPINYVAERAKALGFPITLAQCRRSWEAEKLLGLPIVETHKHAKGHSRYVKRQDAVAFLKQLREKREETEQLAKEAALPKPKQPKQPKQPKRPLAEVLAGWDMDEVDTEQLELDLTPPAPTPEPKQAKPEPTQQSPLWLLLDEVRETNILLRQLVELWK